MGFESNWAKTSDTVRNHYGPRDLYETLGSSKHKTEGLNNELVIEVTNDNYSSVTATLPAGAVPIRAIADVVTAFTFTGGTSPSMDVGTDTSEATNGAGVTLTSAGVEEGTLAGTWTSPLAAATTVGVATAGSPTSVDTGKARIVIEYAYTGDLDGA